MAKVRQIALLALLSVFFFAANVSAGPGGNRNGDPDGPQKPLRSAVPRAGETSLVKQSISPEVAVSERLSYSWQTVIRLYLRWHGFTAR
jgi:hypothetical protein